MQEKQRVGEARTVLPFWWNFEITATEGIRSVGRNLIANFMERRGGRVLGFRKISRSPPNGASNAKFVENSAKGISNWGCCGFRGKRTHVRIRMGEGGEVVKRLAAKLFARTVWQQTWTVDVNFSIPFYDESIITSFLYRNLQDLVSNFYSRVSWCINNC